MRKVGDVVEFFILTNLWRIGIINDVTPDSRFDYRIRFVRVNEEHHNYFRCNEESVRDVVE
jgi:hypothetical protein